MLGAIHARAILDEAGDVDHLRAAPRRKAALHHIDAVGIFRPQLDVHHQDVDRRPLRKTRIQRGDIGNMLDDGSAAPRGTLDHPTQKLGLNSVVFDYENLVHGIGLRLFG